MKISVKIASEPLPENGLIKTNFVSSVGMPIRLKKGVKAFIKKLKKFFHGESTGVRSAVAKSLLDVYGEELSKDSKTYLYLSVVANYKTDKKLKKVFLKEKAFFTNKKNNKYLKNLIRMNKV